MAAVEPLIEIPGARLRLPDNVTDRDLLAKCFRVLGNGTRLGILALLRDDGELSVKESVGRTGSTQPQVSNHLACLHWCGFVTTRREHRTIYYRLADDRVEQILARARSLLADNAEHDCVRPQSPWPPSPCARGAPRSSIASTAT
jgi:ArsR family transcriptional regulator